MFVQREAKDVVAFGCAEDLRRRRPEIDCLVELDRARAVAQELDQDLVADRFQIDLVEDVCACRRGFRKDRDRTICGGRKCAIRIRAACGRFVVALAASNFGLHRYDLSRWPGTTPSQVLR